VDGKGMGSATNSRIIFGCLLVGKNHIAAAPASSIPIDDHILDLVEQGPDVAAKSVGSYTLVNVLRFGFSAVPNDLKQLARLVALPSKLFAHAL
jgi:hypothetical protein